MIQPNIARMLQPGGIVPIDVETTAALVAEITRQHAAIERKDALLRQALEALKRSYGYGTTLIDDSTSDAINAITKELAK